MHQALHFGHLRGTAFAGPVPQLICLRSFQPPQPSLSTPSVPVQKAAPGGRRRGSTLHVFTCSASQSNGYEAHIASANDTSKPRNFTYDVVTLGNLCVDIFIHVKQMPALQELKTPEYLQQLQEQSTDQSLWEVGASCNFLIAAARLGMSCSAVANLGEDVYGRYLLDILQREGVKHFQPLAPTAFNERLAETLLCFVLIDQAHTHAFCSRYDFGPWPLLPGVDCLPIEVHKVLQDSGAMFVAGCCFDELPPAVIMEAVHSHRSSGGAVFFDPGPRSLTFRDPDRRKGLHALLDSTDVVLMTQEEAEAITEISDPGEAAWSILDRPGAATQWCIVKMGGKGALLCTKAPRREYRQSGVQVPVADTVGCGDSFAAAVVMCYTRGHSIPAMLALANAVGAATAMGKGAGEAKLSINADAGRNVATFGAVEGLLQREADGSSAQPVECITNQEHKTLPVEPLAEEALAILQQSWATQNGSRTAPVLNPGSRELSGTV